MFTTEITGDSEEPCNAKDAVNDSNACILSTNPSTLKNTQHNDQQLQEENESKNNIFHIIEAAADKDTLPTDSVVVNDGNNEDQNLVAVSSNNPLVSFPTNNGTLQVVSAETLDNGTSTIYLLVSNDSSNPNQVLQPVDSQNQVTTEDMGVSIITAESNVFKPLGDNISSTHSQPEGTIVQVMNSNGIPVNLHVNDLLNSLTNPRSNNALKKDTIPGILNLSNSIISTTENSSESSVPLNQNKQHSNTQNVHSQYIFDTPSVNQVTSVPNWALHLQDCILCGDTYTGFVTNEIEMDAVLNLYKKETQSLFAIRQTPSPAKDESTDTVRLMWKSQYVPYDGIPFVNVGRRATVMECEHGPRKRSNALKRMAQMHGHKSGLKRIPNLTCPARLFVKKVRKFPQFKVPLEADPKIVRTLQEQSLKLVRQTGIHTGEIRLYMQLPLPSSHGYHHIGNSVEIFQKELENLDDVLLDSMSVDSRVVYKIQEIVRQGYINPFLIRSAVKNFVENKMQLNVNEGRPFKHNKAFYPALIEIKNIIQQTESAISSGALMPLPEPDIPPIDIRPKRKRTSTFEAANQSSPLVIKRVKVDIPADQTGLTEGKRVNFDPPNTGLTSSDGTDTIALTLTDSQLENFSVTNFTYDQLAQLAKIGLIALNNATKDGEETCKTTTTDILNDTPRHQTISMTDGESILVVTPNNAEEEKARLRILTGTLDSQPDNGDVVENDKTN